MPGVRIAELWDAEWLRERYEARQLSLREIASEIECSVPGVRKALLRAGIATRHSGVHLLRHGHALANANSPTYRTWIGMKVRCSNPNHEKYHHYGGRGITVCDWWRDSYENFLADMGERPAGLSIDRIDVNGNYEPGNCRWATQSEQLRNRRPRKKAA